MRKVIGSFFSLGIVNGHNFLCPFDEGTKVNIIFEYKTCHSEFSMIQNDTRRVMSDARTYSSTNSKSSLVTPQSGQDQSSGIASNGVPGAIPLSGSPTAGS